MPTPSGSIFPPDYNTPVGRVRLLVPDTITDDGTAGTDYLIPDDAIAAMLSLYNGSIRRSAAALIDNIANDEALTYKVTRTDDLSINGVQVADALRKRANSLRDEADLLEDAPDGFEIVYPFAHDQTCRPEATTWPWGSLWR